MRSRRSCLSVPAQPPRRLEKGTTLTPDEVHLDLEDSVPPALKEDARAAVVAALGEAQWAAPTVSVRVNARGTKWFEADLAALAPCAERLASVIVPKVESPDDLTEAVALLGPDGTIGVQALIESARGLRDVDAIAEATDRLEALILGPADMSVSLGFPSPAEGSRWDFVRGAVLVAARAAGVQAIDGPFLQISDADGLRASAGRARELGFDGKLVLHPDQIEPINLLFSPTPAETEQARAILAALEDAEDGAVMLDGEMIDEASRKRASALIARAEAAEAAAR